MDDTLLGERRLVEVVQRLIVDHAVDGFGKEPVAAEDADFAALALHGDGIGGHELLKGAVLNLLDSVAAEDGVGNHSADALGAVIHDDAGSLANRGARIDNVVNEDDVLVLHIADKAHLANLVRLVTMLVADNERIVQSLSIHGCTLAAAHVGAGEHHILDVQVLADVRHEQGGAVEVVEGDVEESLDLVGMEVHADDAVDTSRGNHIGNQLGCDRHMGLILAILASKAVIRNDCDNLLSGGTLGGIHHHEKLEEVVRRRQRRLDDEDDTATDGFFVRRLKFSVGILENGGVSQRNSINVGHSASQIFGCTARENEYFIRFFIDHCYLILRLQRYKLFLE